MSNKILLILQGCDMCAREPTPLLGLILENGQTSQDFKAVATGLELI